MSARQDRIARKARQRAGTDVYVHLRPTKRERIVKFDANRSTYRHPIKTTESGESRASLLRQLFFHPSRTTKGDQA